MSAHTVDTLPEHAGVEQIDRNAARSHVHNEDVRDCLDEALFFAGDLSLDGDLDLYNGVTVIIGGNLTVTGSVATDETATLIVRGNLTCRHVFLEGNFEVQGNLTASGVVYGFYEAGISRCEGTTKARIGLIGNHDWECDDEQYEVGIRFANHRNVISGDVDQLKAILGDEAFAGLAPMLGLGESESSNAAWGLKLFAHL